MMCNFYQHRWISCANGFIYIRTLTITSCFIWRSVSRSRESLISDLALYDTPTRLARLLIRYISSNQGDGASEHHDIPLFHDLTHETLAQMIGSARQVVNKHLQALKHEGILKTDDHNWTIENLDALKQKANITTYH